MAGYQGSAPDYSGFSALGDILGGGAKRRSEEQYLPRLGENYRAMDALNEARISNAKAIAAESLPAAIAADPTLSKRLGLNQALLGRGDTLNVQTQGLQNLEELDLSAQLKDALDRGDTTTARKIAAIQQKKVLPSLEANGSAVFDAMTGDVNLTPLGNSRLGVDQTIMGRNLAAGRASDASAYARMHPEINPAAPKGLAGRLPTFEADMTAAEAALGQELTPEERKEYLISGTIGHSKVTNEPVSFKDLLDKANKKPGTPGGNKPLGKARPKPSVKSIASKAQYDALPSGARFIAPDGTTRIKP